MLLLRLKCFYHSLFLNIRPFATNSTGGHLNPAVTFALCLLGREKWRKFPVYFLFQTLGGFFGAGIIFGMYYGKYHKIDAV